MGKGNHTPCQQPWRTLETNTCIINAAQQQLLMPTTHSMHFSLIRERKLEVVVYIPIAGGKWGDINGQLVQCCTGTATPRGLHQSAQDSASTTEIHYGEPADGWYGTDVAD